MNWRSTQRVLGSRAGAVDFRSNTAEQRGLGGGGGIKPPIILSDGNTVARYDRTASNGVVKDVQGRESIYWDLNVGNQLRGAEESSGTLVVYGVYEITATQTDYFFTGCKVGDIFPAGAATVLSANNKVKRVLGNHLTQPVLEARPINGIFDGVDDFMQTVGFTYTQPEQFYLLLNPLTWSNSDTFVDGLTASSGRIIQATTTPKIWGYAGGAGGAGTYQDCVLNQKHILTCKFYSNTVSLQVDDNTPVIGSNIGTAAMGGITIGARPGGACSNMFFQEGIFRKIVDVEQSVTQIKDYLKKKV